MFLALLHSPRHELLAIRVRDSCGLQSLVPRVVQMPHQHGVRLCELNSRPEPLLLSPVRRTSLAFKTSLLLASLSSYILLVLVTLSLFASDFYLLLCIYFIVIANALIAELDLACEVRWCGGIERAACHLKNVFPKTLVCPRLLCQSEPICGLASR